jgi:type II secretory pathway pseudopilin PulG
MNKDLTFHNYPAPQQRGVSHVKRGFGRAKLGFGLIEVLVVAVIVGLVITGLITLANFSLSVSQRLKNNIIATDLATEAIEAAKAVRNENWNGISALTLGSPYHPVKAGSPLNWTLANGNEVINNFSRQIVVSAVNRDNNDDIVTSGGTLDPNTKKITTTVSWSEHGQNYQITLVDYLANWRQ